MSGTALRVAMMDVTGQAYFACSLTFTQEVRPGHLACGVHEKSLFVPVAIFTRIFFKSLHGKLVYPAIKLCFAPPYGQEAETG